MNGRFDQQQFYPLNDWHQQYNQSMNYSSYQPIQTQPTHLTPYEYFAKPRQPLEWFQPPLESTSSYSNQQVEGLSEALSGGNEQIDFDKLLSSIGQIASTYHQVSPIVKQIGSLVKMLK